MDCLFIDIASIKEEAKAFFCFVLRVQFLKIRSAIVFVLYIIAIYTLRYCHKTCGTVWVFFLCSVSVSIKLQKDLQYNAPHNDLFCCVFQ